LEKSGRIGLSCGAILAVGKFNARAGDNRASRILDHAFHRRRRGFSTCEDRSEHKKNDRKKRADS